MIVPPGKLKDTAAMGLIFIIGSYGVWAILKVMGDKRGHPLRKQAK